MSWKDRAKKVEDEPAWKKRATAVEKEPETVEDIPATPPTEMAGPAGEEYSPSLTTRALKLADSIPIVGPTFRQMGEDFYGDYLGYDTLKNKDQRKKVKDQVAEEISEYESKRPIESFAVGMAGGAPMALMPGGVPAQIATGMAVQAGDSYARGKNAEEVGEDVLLSGGIDTALSGLGWLGRGVKNMAKNVGRRTLLGVPDDIAERYKTRRKEVNAINQDESIARAEGFQNALKNRKDYLGSEEADAREMKRIYDQQVKADLQKASPDLEVIREIAGDIKLAQKETSELSNNVFDKLKESGRTFPKKDARQSLMSQMDRLRIAGEIDPKDAAPFDYYLNKVLKEIKDPTPKEMEALTQKMLSDGDLSPRELEIIAFQSGEISNDLSAEDMKSLLMKLDNDTSQSYDKFSRGEKPSLGERRLLDFAKSVRNDLNEIPEYDEAMAPLRNKTQVVNDLTDFISSDDVDVNRFLKNLNKPENEKAKTALDMFGLERGKDYLGKLTDYNKMKYVRENPVELHGYLKNLPQAKNLDKAQLARRAAEEELEAAGGKFNVRHAMRTGHLPDFSSKPQFFDLEKLGSKMGRNLTEETQDIGVQNFFKKELGNSGSRLTTAGGGMGRVVGGALGVPNLGDAAGRLAGSSLDVYKRQIYKSLSDLRASKYYPDFILDGIAALAEKSPRDAMLEINRLRGRSSEEEGSTDGAMLQKKNLEIDSEEGRLIRDDEMLGSGFDQEIPGRNKGMKMLRDSLSSVFGNTLDTSMDVADLLAPESYGDLAMPLPKSLRGLSSEINLKNIPEDISPKAKELLQKLLKDKDIKISNTKEMEPYTSVELRKGSDDVASFDFREEYDYLKPTDSMVKSDFRRNGIASDSYQLIEELFGKKLVRGDIQTKAGKSLWDNPNRKFGDKKREYSPEMEVINERTRLIDIWDKETSKLQDMKNAFSDKYGKDYLDNLNGQEKLNLQQQSFGVDYLDKRIKDLFK